jgi:hypothetical protein
MKSMPQERSVAITDSGRGGSILYREGSLELRFDWEFGGSCLALIWGSALRYLRDSGGLSPERAREILEFVAGETVAQKAAGHPFAIDEQQCEITIR